MKKLISILLLVAMLVLALASCGKDKKKTTAPTTTAPIVTTTPAPSTTTPAPSTTTQPTTTTPAPSTTTQPTTTTPIVEVDPWESISSEVKGMDASLRDIIIHMSETTNSGVKNREYVEGPASRDNASTIQGYIYDRNQEAYERLGLTVHYVYNAWEWGAAYGEIVGACNATQTADSPDMYVNLMYDMVGAALAGVFRELTTIEGSYFNFETQGWFNDIMSDVSFDRERLYLIASDYYLDIVRNMFVTPFNLSLVDSSTSNADLVAAITGQAEFENKDADGNRQYLSDFLFDLVRDGKWTFDKLTEICAAIYSDSDSVAGDSKDDSPMGLFIDAAGGNMSAAILYSTDTTFIVEGVDETGKLTMTYPATGDAINKVYLAAEKLITGDGTHIMEGTHLTANEALRAKFSAGEAFSLMAEMLGTFESDEYTSMTDIFSVLPIPLLEAGSVDDHNTPIHNCAALGAINIRSAKWLPITAFIQYVTEHDLTQDIREEYLQIIMKYDLIEYNAGTDEMLDIVYDHLKSCREMIIDNIVSQQKASQMGTGDKRWHGILKGQKFLSGEFLSQYESIRGVKQTALEELLAQWRTLPTQDAPPVQETPAE